MHSGLDGYQMTRPFHARHLPIVLAAFATSPSTYVKRFASNGLTSAFPTFQDLSTY